MSEKGYLWLSYYKVWQCNFAFCHISRYKAWKSNFITKCVRYYKAWQTIITKCVRYCKVWQTLLQSASGITKCDSYYKVRRNIFNIAFPGYQWKPVINIFTFACNAESFALAIIFLFFHVAGVFWQAGCFVSVSVIVAQDTCEYGRTVFHWTHWQMFLWTFCLLLFQMLVARVCLICV